MQKILAKNIVELRQSLGYSQELLAEKAGLSWTSIAHIETCRRWPTVATLQKVAEALGVPEEDLFRSAGRSRITVPEALARIGEDYGLTVKPKTRRRNNTENNPR